MLRQRKGTCHFTDMTVLLAYIFQDNPAISHSSPLALGMDYKRVDVHLLDLGMIQGHI